MGGFHTTSPTTKEKKERAPRVIIIIIITDMASKKKLVRTFAQQAAGIGSGGGGGGGDKAAKATADAAGSVLNRLAPWKITGPASDPEWHNVPVSAEAYRARSPASFPHENTKVPNSETDRVFNVRYYPRDSRRAREPVLHGKEKVKTVARLSPATSSEEWDEILGHGDIQTLDPTQFYPGKRDPSQDHALKSSGYRTVPLLENPGGGYTAR